MAEPNGSWRNYQLNVPPDSPCGCGSGRPFGECHMPAQGSNLEFYPRDVRPAAPNTGYLNEKCYLRGFRDCTDEITGEHVISAAVLRTFSSGVIEFPRDDRIVRTSAGGDPLKTKVLCRRHNEAFRP
jgi:hypothetical protein